MSFKIDEDTRLALFDVAYVIQVFAFIVLVTVAAKAFVSF